MPVYLDLLVNAAQANKEIDGFTGNISSTSTAVEKAVSNFDNLIKSVLAPSFQNLAGSIQDLNSGIDRIQGSMGILNSTILDNLIPTLKEGRDTLSIWGDVGGVIAGVGTVINIVSRLEGKFGVLTRAVTLATTALAPLAPAIGGVAGALGIGFGVGTAVNELIGLADTSQVVEGAMKSQRLELMNWTLAELEGGKATGDLDRLIRDPVLSLGQANEAAAAHGDAVELVQGRYELVSGALEDAELRETENIYSLALAA